MAGHFSKGTTPRRNARSKRRSAPLVGDVLGSLDWFIRAKDYTGSGDWLDGSGGGHDATLVGTPVFRDFDVLADDPYWFMPGMAENFLRASGSANPQLNLTGDIDLRVEWFPDSTPMVQYLSGKGAVGDPNGFAFRMNTDRSLTWLWGDGTGINTEDSTDVLADLSRRFARATFRPDDGASSFELKFFTASDEQGPWSPLGTTVTGAATTIGDNASRDFLGGQLFAAGADAMMGELYRITMYDGIDGTKVLDVSGDGLGWQSHQVGWTDETGVTWSTAHSTDGTFLPLTIVKGPLFGAFGDTNFWRLADESFWDVGAGDFTWVGFCEHDEQPVLERRSGLTGLAMLTDDGKGAAGGLLDGVDSIVATASDPYPVAAGLPYFQALGRGLGRAWTITNNDVATMSDAGIDSVDAAATDIELGFEISTSGGTLAAWWHGFAFVKRLLTVAEVRKLAEEMV